MLIDYADDHAVEQMVTLGSVHSDIEAAYADALREAATRVRAIRSLADFDARTAQIAAQSTAAAGSIR